MSAAASQLAEMIQSRRKLAEELSFFDGNVWLGSPEGFPLAQGVTASQLESALQQSFIGGALVSHWRGLRVSAQEGNRALSDTSERLSESFYCIWTGLPLASGVGGLLPGRGELPEKVRGVRLFPATHSFPLVDWVIGGLCDWLSERNIPLFVWHTEITWAALHELALKFPKLKIVVESQTKKILYHTRPLFALMRECPNIIVETSNFVGSGFIEYAVSEFGAGRLIFGSFVPVGDPFVPMGMIVDAAIAESDKVLIAGENLRRLIAGTYA